MLTRHSLRLLLPFILLFLVACGRNTGQTRQDSPVSSSSHAMNLDTATFGEGCFWCSEAIFQQVRGVDSVVSGFAGGTVPNPSYEEVCTGSTGHAEASQIVFDPSVVSYSDLLEIFWKTHDPTTLNRQGNDVGTQYRSVIFFHTPEQKRIAEELKRRLDSAKVFDEPIVTEIVPYTNFYKAEDYHQNYYNEHGNQPYCRLVIQPKLEKFLKAFHGKLKPER